MTKIRALDVINRRLKKGRYKNQAKISCVEDSAEPFGDINNQLGKLCLEPTTSIPADNEPRALNVMSMYSSDVTEITDIMTAYVTDPKVQERSCNTLRILANDPSKERDICNANVMPLVVRAMKAHLQVPLVQVSACALLQKLTFNKAKNFVTVTGNADDATMITSLNQDYGNNETQEFECSSLENMVNYSMVSTRALVTAEGIQAILDAMNEHQDNMSVQSYACAALLCFTVCSEYLILLGGKNPQPLLDNAVKRFPGLCGKNVKKVLERLKEITH